MSIHIYSRSLMRSVMYVQIILFSDTLPSESPVYISSIWMGSPSKTSSSSLSLQKCLWLFTDNDYHLNHRYNHHYQSQNCPNWTRGLPHVRRACSASVQCLRFSFFRESQRNISFNQMTNQKLTSCSTHPYMEHGCPMSN